MGLTKRTRLDLILKVINTNACKINNYIDADTNIANSFSKLERNINSLDSVVESIV